MEKENSLSDNKLSNKECQKEILYFLYGNVNKRFSVSQIWEELVGKYNISYNLVSIAIQWLQYQKDSVIKTKRKGWYKYVWIET